MVYETPNSLRAALMLASRPLQVAAELRAAPNAGAERVLSSGPAAKPVRGCALPPAPLRALAPQLALSARRAPAGGAAGGGGLSLKGGVALVTGGLGGLGVTTARADDRSGAAFCVTVTS